MAVSDVPPAVVAESDVKVMKACWEDVDQNEPDRPEVQELANS